MVTGVSPAVAIPSMSWGPRPASCMALSAASAWRPICDNSGMRPISVVSAAPTMAMLSCFIGSTLRRLTVSRPEQRQGDVVVELLEGDLDRHVEHQRLWGLRAVDDVGDHPRPFVEFDDGDRIRLSL